LIFKNLLNVFANPATFPLLIQSAIWRFCAADAFDICNGNRIRSEALRKAGRCPRMRLSNERPMTGFVQGFGCLQRESCHALVRKASEKRQGTKSRAGRGSVLGQCSMGIEAFHGLTWKGRTGECGVFRGAGGSPGEGSVEAGMIFGAAAAIAGGWQGVIGRAPSALANGQRQG
jgi:hypothetical protein